MKSIIVVTRSIVYNIFYILWTAVLGVFYIPIFAYPGRMPFCLIRFWTKGLLYGAWLLAGIRWKVEGLEHFPSGPCLIVSNHSSAWETFFFPAYVDVLTLVLKRELLRIPLVGWYMAKAGSIAVDRQAGASALRRMQRDAQAVFDRQGKVLIFPEGTRSAVVGRFHPGVAGLYGQCGDSVPVIPVAVDSGRLWKRNAFLKHPGTIVVRFLPPVPPNMDKRAFLQFISERIAREVADLRSSAAPQE